MQAQTTTRMAGPNGLIVAVLAIALATLTIVGAAKISGIGQSSGSQQVAEMQVERGGDGAPPAVTGLNNDTAASVDAAGIGTGSLIEDLRFLELNTMLPGYGSTGASRLAVNDMLFLEANLYLPGPTVQPGSQMLTNEILFLESNLHMPGMDAHEAAPSAEETHFIEINTDLPSGESAAYKGKLPRE